jgi:hypothetical protein
MLSTSLATGRFEERSKWDRAPAYLHPLDPSGPVSVDPARTWHRPADGIVFVLQPSSDKVAVTNLVNHRHVQVRAGHSYLAKAP